MNKNTNNKNINIDEVVLYKKRELSEKGKRIKEGSYKKVQTFLISFFISLFLTIAIILTGFLPSQWFKLFRIEGILVIHGIFWTINYLLKYKINKMTEKEYTTHYYCDINDENFEITKEEYEKFEIIKIRKKEKEEYEKNIKKLKKQEEIKQRLLDLYEEEVLKKKIDIEKISTYTKKEKDKVKYFISNEGTDYEVNKEEYEKMEQILTIYKNKEMDKEEGVKLCQK